MSENGFTILYGIKITNEQYDTLQARGIVEDYDSYDPILRLEKVPHDTRGTAYDEGDLFFGLTKAVLFKTYEEFPKDFTEEEKADCKRRLTDLFPGCPEPKYEVIPDFCISNC